MQQSVLMQAVHAALALLGVALAAVILLYQTELGRQPLTLRAAFAGAGLLLFTLGIRPWLPWFRTRLTAYLLTVCLPAVALAPLYYLVYLPPHDADGLQGEQLASSRITDSTSNGIIEIGFAYPIYTPTVRIANPGLFTTEVDVYLRILDGNNEASLFRAVRKVLPDRRLSVEATVNGLLSELDEYLLLPVTVPPRGAVEGKVAFIISDLNDGSTFNEALGRSYPASFEVRDPESGELLLSFPMTHI